MPAPLLNLMNANMPEVAQFRTKALATAAIKALRAKGIFQGDPERAIDWYSRFWVVASSDRKQRTILLRTDGLWTPGLLDGDAWRPVDGPFQVAVEHRTRVVTGSVAVAGDFPHVDGRGVEVERLGWLASAYCVACPKWSSHWDDETMARSAARVHRAVHATLTVGAVVRYAGSIVEQHGLYVVTDVEVDGRYQLADPNFPDFVMRQVRRESLTPTGDIHPTNLPT